MGKGVEGKSALTLEPQRGGDIPSILPLKAALSSFPDELPYLKCPLHTVLKLTPVAYGECPHLHLRKVYRRYEHACSAYHLSSKVLREIPWVDS